MTFKHFYQLFVLTSVSCFILIALILQMGEMQPHSLFLSLTMLLFMGFTVWTFHLGKAKSTHPNKQLFTRFILMSIGLKMLLTILLIAIYKLAFHPENNNFGIPFILIYLFFSICENYSLIKLSKNSI